MNDTPYEGWDTTVPRTRVLDHLKSVEATMLSTQVAGEGVRSSSSQPGDSRTEQDGTGLDESRMNSSREVPSSQSELVKASARIRESGLIHEEEKDAGEGF